LNLEGERILDFVIKFTEKPNHATKKLAVQIAKECDYKLIDGVYFVHFNEINSKLIKLLNFTQNWTAAEFIVDQGKVDSSKVYDILFCSRYETCNGFCEKVQLIPQYNLGFFITRLHNYIEQNFFPDPRSWEGQILDARYVQKTDDPNICLINKETIIEETKKQIQYPLIYCDKINERKCLDPIESLPNIIEKKICDKQIDLDDVNDDETNEKFEGLTEYNIKFIEAEANIKAPIYAKAIAKELEELFKKNIIKN
jgi:hypothetical protein